jgi:capsid protein
VSIVPVPCKCKRVNYAYVQSLGPRTWVLQWELIVQSLSNQSAKVQQLAMGRTSSTGSYLELGQ